MIETGGKCSLSNSGYNCSCPRGFSGNNCEINEDDCKGVVCQNGGTCRDETRGYRCQCPIGFSGKWCQNRVDLCRGFPCANGGTCLESDGIDFTCACAPGFTGKHCSSNINDCDPEPCLNGGLCLDRVNEFQCHCPPSFFGNRCQFRNDTIHQSGDREVLQPTSSQVLESGADGDGLEEQNIIRILIISFGFVLMLLALVAIVIALRKHRKLMKERKREEEMAKCQNEANYRKNQSLDPHDRFRGSMIINSLRDDPKNFRTSYQLNREKSATLSKLSNNEMYESNLKYSGARACFEAQDVPTKCSNKVLVGQSELAKSAGKLNTVHMSQGWEGARCIQPYPTLEAPFPASHPVNVHSFITSLRRSPERHSERLPQRTFQATSGSSAVRWTGVEFKDPC